MPRSNLERHIEERINFIQRELTTFMVHVLREDKATAQSSLKALHIYVDSLDRLVDTLPDPPNVRPGYAYGRRRFIDDADAQQALLEAEGFYDETGPPDKPAADDSPT